MKIRKIQLNGHPFFGNFECHFTGTDEKTLDTIVIAGINGSGKTTLLDTIFQVINNNDKKFPSSQMEIEFNEYSDNDIGDIVVLDHTQGFPHIPIWDRGFKDLEPVNKPKIIYIPTEINFENLETKTLSFSSTYQFENIVDRKVIEDVPSFIASTVNGEVYKNPDLPAKQAIDKVCESINSLFDVLEIDAQMIGINPEGEKLPIFKNSAGKTFDINKLSSGEKQLFVRAMTLKMLGANNSVILIDEPEISMHPAWQQRIINVYQNIGQNNQIIVATHSPHVVSSVKKECVKLLRREKGTIKLVEYKDIDGSYGLPVEMVLKELMELKSVRAPEIDDEIRALWDLLNSGKFDENEFTHRYTRLESLLGNDDEDLLLMRIEIAKQKMKKGKGNAENKKS